MPAPNLYFELAVINDAVTFALFRDPAGNINGLAETGSFAAPSAG